MRIGIDVSQIAYEKTGVANYLINLVIHLLEIDKENEYILFFSSMRKTIQNSTRFNWDKIQKYNPKLKIKTFRIPPTFLDILWNRLHVLPIEWLIGNIDIFISSDWTAPPTVKAKKATIFYDLIVYKYPEETAKKIVETQKRRLSWVKKESDLVFCISEATKRDAIDILGIDKNKLKVLYPGI